MLIRKIKNNIGKIITAVVGGALLGSAATYGLQLVDDLDAGLQNNPQDANFQTEEKQNDVRTESSQLADQLEINNSGEPERQLYSC